MRIALINPVLGEGGAGRAMVNMANHWADQHHGVTLFTFEGPDTPPNYRLADAVQLLHLDLERESANALTSLRNNLWRFRRIRREVLATAPDVVVSFIDTGNVRVLLALLFARVPVIVSERVHPGFEPLAWHWRVLRRLTYPLASGVVVQTEAIARYVRSWGLRRVHTIANPVPAFQTPHTDPPAPRPYLLAMGRLRPQKAFDNLVAAFAQVAEAHADWALVIAGDGPLRNSLATQAQQLGIADRVHLIGQQTDVAGLLEHAELFALSSRYEGFPNALCEAMAAGIACVATDCPSGPTDIIEDGNNGLLVATDDVRALASALDRLMSDAQLRKELGAAATHVAERFGVATVMADWDDLLEVVSRRRAAPPA